MTATHKAFLDDAYQRECPANVMAVRAAEDGKPPSILLDTTNFYATSGGQPGDNGWLLRQDGTRIAIANTVYGPDRAEILLIPEDGAALPEIGEQLTGVLDWERRHRLMRMHTACHLLSVVCPFPITSANVGDGESRIDFDLPEAGITKEAVTEEMMALIEADHPVYAEWITEAALDANPDLVKSKNVKPPRGKGDIRLVCIGDTASVDSQPCGGTHVARTGEIGPVHIGKIEKKGKENRRFRIRFGPLPA